MEVIARPEEVAAVAAFQGAIDALTDAVLRGNLDITTATEAAEQIRRSDIGVKATSLFNRVIEEKLGNI